MDSGSLVPLIADTQTRLVYRLERAEREEGRRGGGGGRLNMTLFRQGGRGAGSAEGVHGGDYGGQGGWRTHR